MVLIKELDLSEQVLLPGNVSDLHEKMRTADLFVLSSDYEGMPNALIEAMCLGLPVVSTKVSGTAELVLKDQNGILVDCNNEKQLVDAIDEILSDNGKRERYARENIKLAEKLGINLITKECLDLIEEVRKI